MPSFSCASANLLDVSDFSSAFSESFLCTLKFRHLLFYTSSVLCMHLNESNILRDLFTRLSSRKAAMPLMQKLHLYQSGLISENRIHSNQFKQERAYCRHYTYQVNGRGKVSSRLGFQEPLTKPHCRCEPLRELLPPLASGNLHLHNSAALEQLETKCSPHVSHSQILKKNERLWSHCHPYLGNVSCTGADLKLLTNLDIDYTGVRCSVWSKELHPKEVTPIWHRHAEGVCRGWGCGHYLSSLLWKSNFPSANRVL